jgi:hypothetical protein
MAFDSADWSIDYVNKEVTNDDSGTGNWLPSAFGDYSHVGDIIDFFQWLATTFAASAQMDDEYPIQSDTPTVYKWLNGWTFGHADDYKYLRGGSIEDPAGSGTAFADSLWSNLYSIGSQEVGTQLYMIQADDEVTPWWITGNIDILVLVKNAGSWIQSDDVAGTPTNGGLWIYAREFGDTYDHNFTDLSGGGRNPIGINTAPDSGNKSGEVYVTVGSSSGTWTVGNFLSDDTTGATGKIVSVNGNDVYLNAVRGGTLTPTNGCSEYTDRELQSAGDASGTISSVTDVVAAWSGITDTFGAISRDLNNGNGAQGYDVEIDCNSKTMAQVYEWLKYIVRYGSAETVNGDAGQEYRSADEGTYKDVKVAPFGTLAGSTFYGARGVWVTGYASADFVLIDDANVEQSPPNYQKVSVSHTNLSGCNIFVAEISGGAIIKDQYTVDSATSNSITATVSIDINKVPQSGVLRVGDTQYNYTGFSGAVFTGVTPDPSGLTSEDFYVPLLDVLADETPELSADIIYNAAFDVRTSVRKYGFKPYDVDTQFTAAGLTFSPILTTDPQAT